MFPPWGERRWTPRGAALLVGILALLATGLALYRERADTLRDGQRAASRLSQVLEEQTLRTVQAVDLTLLGMLDALALARDLPPNDPTFQETLRRRRDLLPFVRALLVFDARGALRQDTNHPYTPPLTVADRPYFRAHQDDGQLGLHIGPPLRSRAVGSWFVAVTRRIDGPAGRFGGVVAAIIEPRYFERFYETLHLGTGDSIAIFHRDGTLYWRTPSVEPGIGASFLHLGLFRRELPAQPAGVFRASGLMGEGGARLVSYRALDTVPLVVVVTLDERRLLAGWWRAAAGAIAATVILVALTAVVVALLGRQARQRERVRELAAEAHRLEALGRMTGGLAHDFSNVLQVISTNLDVIRRTVRPVPEPIEAAIRAARQGIQIAGRLLAFARRQALSVESVDTGALLADVLPLLRQAAGPSVDITTGLAADAWPCLADPAELSSALLNLVVNARDAMPRAAGRIRITTENCTLTDSSPDAGYVLGDYLCLTVTDTGAGMPPDVLRRAREPFFTTKPRGVGTGLGLSQVHGFVRQVGGDVRIESAPDRGTAVRLFLRRAPVPAAVGAERPGVEAPVD